MTAEVIETLHMILSAAWRRRYLIAVPVLVLPFVGLAAGKALPRTYEVRMAFVVQEPASLNPFLKDLSVETHLKERMAGLTALARSEHILGGVVSDLKLVSDGASPVERERVVKRIAAGLAVQLVGADLIELRLRGADRASLNKVLSAIGARFVDRLLAPERSSIGGSVDFLSRQLTEQRQSLDEVEGRLADFKARNADRLPAAFGTNTQRLATARQTLQDKRIQLAGANAAFEDLRARLIGTNPVIGQIEETIVRITAEVALLRARYTDDHSEVQAALRKLRRLEEEKANLIAATENLGESDLERLWTLSASAGANRAATEGGVPGLLVAQLERLQMAQAGRTALRQEIETLAAAARELEETIAAYGPVERALQGLEREVTARRETFDALHKRHEMARVTGALGTFEAPERIKLIEAPSEPVAPVTPPVILFAFGGIAAGVALGFGLALVAEVTDTRLRRRRATEASLGAPVLSRIPDFS